MEIPISFRNEAQAEFYNSVTRNICFSGGFCNGKSYILCLKTLTLLLTFPNYRSILARQFYSDLKKTTMQTFFKICPPQLISRHTEQEGITTLKNRSTIYWMHLDSFDEQSLKSLEINSAGVDQAEEISEGIYLVLDSRIGRWDQAIVPKELLNITSNWPQSDDGKYRVPTYMMLACNPDNQFHWIYRRYHPESSNRISDHFMIQAPTDPSLGDPETYKQMLTRDSEWVNKYVKGTWGISEAQIHIVHPDSILEPTEELLHKIKTKAALYRSLDHGESSPTCCLWFAVLNGVYICFREYYLPNALISEHRRNINDISLDEKYCVSYADPTIFHKASQKDGGYWSVADEYMTSSLNSPKLFWLPADNNEFATRNRINELLKPSFDRKHPITGRSPSPGLYFVRKTQEYSTGCEHIINQLKAQKREKVGEYNGKIIYSDEREESIADHAYDPLRYFVAMHGNPLKESRKEPPKRSFAYFNRILNRNRIYV